MHRPSSQNRTVLAVEMGTIPTPNSFFTYQSFGTPISWQIESLHPTSKVFCARVSLSSHFPCLPVIQPDGSLLATPRQMKTATAGESVTFTFNQTTAFFLRGTLNYDHGHKSVTFTPHSNAGQATTTTILDYSTTLDFDQILYWQSGLDRDQSYTVQITQLADGNSTNFSFSGLDIIDEYVN